MKHPFQSAFTLSELLIALVILGVIATFTIPKILQSQQSAQYNAIAKEAAGMFSEAYAAYKANHTLSANTTPMDLTPYMNYVKIDSTGLLGVDDWGPTSCDTASTWFQYCMVLHNGAILVLNSRPFGGTGQTDAIWIMVDKDGRATGEADEAGLWFALYYNGRIRTWATIEPNTNGTFNPVDDTDPPWFSWD